mgnify:CR=1 FL=1
MLTEITISRILLGWLSILMTLIAVMSYDEKNIKTESADIEYIAKDGLSVSGETKEHVEKFIEEIEENEDVTDYYSNLN